MDKIYITKYGTDGFGHQLHGLFTCLIFHGIKNYHFDGFSYINNEFKFEHIDDIFTVKKFLIEILSLFIDDKKITQNIYTKKITITDLKLAKYDIETLYILDNVFQFYNYGESNLLNHNIINYRKYFFNKYLPLNRLKPNNIVIHIRMGDAYLTKRFRHIYKSLKNLPILIDILNLKYPSYQIYIHTDEPSICFQQNNIIIFYRNEPVLNVLSDILYSKIFVSGISSLSTIGILLSDKELVIIPDKNIGHDYYINGQYYTMTNYINLFKGYS